MVVLAIVIPLVLWLVHFSGPMLLLTLAAAQIGIVVTLSVLIPTFIVPIFYTMSELEDGELKQAIFKEARKAGISVIEIKVINGARLSS